MENNKEIGIDLKSEPMNEMLSNPPSWITRSGNGMFLIILLSVIGLSWLIEYSDEIIGEGLVTTSQPPIELSNQQYVQLKSVAVHDQQRVMKGQILAQFDNQAKTEDIEKATRYLTTLKSVHSGAHHTLPLIGEQLNLGVYQEAWTLLETRINEWNSLQKDNLLKNTISSLQVEINYRQQLEAISKKKIKLSERDYAMIQEELMSSERLADANAISKQTLNQEKRGENQALQTVQNQKEQYVQNLIQLNSLRKNLLQLKHDSALQEKEQESAISLSIASLLTSFQDWKKSAIWVAPCAGEVLFNTHLQRAKFYQPNQATIVVVPVGSSYIATATIDSRGAGKVKIGQRTFIELIDYPKTEYGMLEGEIVHITHIDKAGKYEVTIRLPKQLKTTFNKQIPSKAQLKGIVKIITKRKRLLDRFFEKLTDLIK